MAHESSTTSNEQTSQAVQRLMDQYTEIARLAGALARHRADLTPVA